MIYLVLEQVGCKGGTLTTLGELEKGLKSYESVSLSL